MDAKPDWIETYPSEDCDAAEWEARCDLAATFHLLRKYRMTDITNQYASVRLPGQQAFVTQRYGWVNEEVTASNLIKCSLDNETLEPEKGEPNPAGVEITSALFNAYPEMNCLMHVHTRNIMGISALECGLLPVSQAFLMAGGAEQIAYSRYEFECTKEFIDNLVAAMKGKAILIEAFHGAFILGRSVADAFFKTFYLDQACNVQLAAQSTGQKVMAFSAEEQARHLHDMHRSGWYHYDGSFEWPALLRICDREAPQYKS